MKFKTFLLFLFLFMIACTSDEESERQVNSAYQGEWVGDFSGDNTGVINFTVDKAGIINGSLSFSGSNSVENFQGYVAFDGKFDINTPNNYYFSGFLDRVRTVTGQWKKIISSNSILSGNYKINKK